MMRRRMSGPLGLLLVCFAVVGPLPGCSPRSTPPKEFLQEESGKGLTAGLWLLTRDSDGGSPQQQHVRVQRGQELSAADYQLNVHGP